MTSSGTYSYNLNNGSIVIAAYERLAMRLPSLRQEHFYSARNELNLLLSALANKQPNLWKVTPTVVTLTAGTATYDVPAKVVMILDAVVSLDYGTVDQVDLYVTPLSRTEFVSISQKQIQGRPTSYWFDRQINPTLTFWPVPDDSQTYTLVYYGVTQMEDANLPGGETMDVPYRWLDAIVAGLAHRLSRVYAPAQEALRKADATDAWMIAAEQDVENVSFNLAPGLGGYYPI